MRCSANRRFRFHSAAALVLSLLLAGGNLLLVSPNQVVATELSGAESALPSYGVETLAAERIPLDLGQTDLQVYLPETGHTIRGYFLDYWRANGGQMTFGNPISEPYASFDGRYSQAFQNGILQYYPELVWTDEPSVRLMDVPPMLMKERLDDFRGDDRRYGGGGDRRSASWKPVDPVGKTAQAAYAEGGTWFEATGHTLTGGFYNWYQSNEGAYYLGNPISQEVRERGVIVQYFQAGVLMMNEYGSVSMAPIIEEQAWYLGVDTTPVEYAGQPYYEETLFWNRDNPNPMGSADAPGRKWIEVSISQQRLWAYQGDTLITTTLVSTGLDPNSTEKGWFHVRYKLPKTDMAGTVNSRGEVVSVDDGGTGEEGQPPPEPGESAYQVKDIPNVMYFNYDAEALHGAYWHNNFGNKMSHGCVNLPLDMADFLYGWSPLGTVVWVHE